MRLLLYESLPRRLGPLLVGHDVITVADAGWAGLTNGRLLGIAQREFDCLVTADRSLVYQQSLPQFDIAVIVLRAKTNRREDLAPRHPPVQSAVHPEGSCAPAGPRTRRCSSAAGARARRSCSTRCRKRSSTRIARKSAASGQIRRWRHVVAIVTLGYMTEVPFPTTEYFRAVRTRSDRAIIRDDWIREAIERPVRESVQADGRVRRWAMIPEADGRALRVVLLPDQLTVHNAFFDRTFRP